DGVKVADATAEGDTLTLTDATAQTGQRYTYTVRARYAAGLVGTLSGERSFEIPLVDAPELTSWEGTYIDSPAVALEWTAVSAAGGTVKYQLYRNDGSGWATVGGLLEASSYNDTTVPAGALCTYSVRAVLVLSDGTEIPGVFDSEGVSVYVPVLPAPTWESEPTLTDGAVISMNWNEVPGTDGYRVVRFVDHQENLEVDLPADVTEYIDADVEIGTAASYAYLIVPLKEDGYDTATGENLQWSGEIMIAPFLAAPNALAVEELRDRSVLLSWSHPQGYTYVVEVLEDDVLIGSYVVKSDTPTLDTAKVKPLENDLLQERDAILELEADTTYTVRVSGAGVSRDGEGEIVGYLRGRYTEISFTTKPAAPALDEPVLRTNDLAGLKVFAFGVDLSWDGEGYDGYVIERNGVQVATLSGGDTSWSDNDAVSGELTYTLRGYTMEGGARVFSGPAACTIEIPSLGRATVTGKIQLPEDKEMPVVQIAGGEDDFDDVLIAYRQPGGEWDYALHDDAVFGGGVTYQVRAAAYKTVGDVTYLGPWSDIREDRYGQLPAPAVEQLSLVQAGTALEARWPAVDGYDGYAVYLNGAHVDSVSASEVVVGPNKLFCTLAGLTSGRQYEVYVRGYNIVNGKTVLGAMPEGEAKKSYTIPTIAAPGWNSATNGEGNYAQLNWQKLTVDGFNVGYELSRTVKGGRTAEPVVLEDEQYSVGDTHISYQDITVAPVTYTYQVRACIVLSDDTVYCGPWSAPSEEVVLGGFGVFSTVRNVQAVTVDGTTIKVSWDKVDGAVGYEIYRLTEAYTSPDQLT
ncbi:MAG: hypothetical protein J6J81_03140, partial [Oscillospiraceae bacterium]|nr:hypothetical protein [Oscillospiraceae bacterium]